MSAAKIKSQNLEHASTKFTHATIKTYNSVSNNPAHNLVEIRNICSFNQLITNLNYIN